MFFSPGTQRQADNLCREKPEIEIKQTDTHVGSNTDRQAKGTNRQTGRQQEQTEPDRQIGEINQT